MKEGGAKSKVCFKRGMMGLHITSLWKYGSMDGFERDLLEDDFFSLGDLDTNENRYILLSPRPMHFVHIYTCYISLRVLFIGLL